VFKGCGPSIPLLKNLVRSEETVRPSYKENNTLKTGKMIGTDQVTNTTHSEIYFGSLMSTD